MFVITRKMNSANILAAEKKLCQWHRGTIFLSIAGLLALSRKRNYAIAQTSIRRSKVLQRTPTAPEFYPESGLILFDRSKR
jgi:hypothetical protein